MTKRQGTVLRAGSPAVEGRVGRGHSGSRMGGGIFRGDAGKGHPDCDEKCHNSGSSAHKCHLEV